MDTQTQTLDDIIKNRDVKLRQERLIDFEKEFGDHKKNEECWINSVQRQFDEDFEKIRDTIKQLYKNQFDCVSFRTSLKEKYNFTQMVGPVGLAKFYNSESEYPEIKAIEAQSCNFENVDEVMKLYPPEEYDFYFYQVKITDSKLATLYNNKYHMRYAVVKKMNF
jgi:hypothetical protein